MRFLILSCALLLAQVPQKSEQPKQPTESEPTAQEIPKQIEPLPALPNPVGSTTTAPVSKPEQESATNSYDGPHHLVTYINLFCTALIALFTFLTWRVYKAMLRATKVNERAWIVPNVGKIEPTRTYNVFQIKVNLQNNGRTAARITSAGSAAKGSTKETPLPTDPPYTEMTPFPEKGTPLLPNGYFEQGFSLPRERLDHVLSGQSQFFIFGYAKYKDAYGDPHIIRYCFEAQKSLDVNLKYPVEFYVNGPNEYIEAD